MMELPKGFIPPSDTVQILLEAPGIIRQSELRRFVDLRRNENVLTKAQGEFLTVLSDDLNERFEDGWLVQMGLIQMYRDHTGIVVIEEDRSTVEVPKGFFPPSPIFSPRVWKGGALAPPKSRLPPSVRPAPRAACSRKLRGARGTGIIRKAL